MEKNPSTITKGDSRGLPGNGARWNLVFQREGNLPMKTRSMVILVAAVIGLSALAQERSASVVKQAGEVRDATVKGDYSKVAEMSLDAIVAELGGKEKMIENIRKGMEQIKERGFEIKAYNIGEPGAFIEKDRKTFVVVPTTMEMKFPKGLIRSKSFLLAISSDMGKTWKFADGAGISKNPGLREKLVPDLPKELEFPKPATPEIIPNP